MHHVLNDEKRILVTLLLFVGRAIELAGGGNITVPGAIWHLISNSGAIHLGVNLSVASVRL